MTVKLTEERVEAERPKAEVIGDVRPPDELVHTEYIRVVFHDAPEPWRGKPVVGKLPEDWPYPPEEGYD
jgi:hypothetical protein